MGGGHEEGNGEEFLPEATEKLDVKTIEQVVCKEEVDDTVRGKNNSEQISLDKDKKNLWRESESKGLGRILVASRDILPWEQVKQQLRLFPIPKSMSSQL